MHQVRETPGMQSERKRLTQMPQRLGSCSRLELPLLALLIP